jgi:hypothetical protein
VCPNYSWLTSFEALVESSRKNNVSYAVFVADTGYEALDYPFCAIHGDLSTAASFELDVVECLSWHRKHLRH